MKNKPELLLPAGSFAAAIYAFKNGADAVYFGLKDFSARKNAANFSFEELRRLKRYSSENGRKIYAAVNTIITEKELPRLYAALEKLAILEIDGVIIQDAGLIPSIKGLFPSLALHASTQMGIHTKCAAAYVVKEGIRRIILARELSVSEIRRIKEAVPEAEIEVFIHGALCYSFSGLCLASGKLLGRSANRGECAQICRTWFESGNRKGYFFSMKDLSAHRKLADLKEAGVSSFKVEGRMKPPEYAGLTAELYSGLIEGKISQESWENASLPSRTVFSRPFTDSWISGNFKSQVTCSTFPSHTGIIAGAVISADRNSFSLKLANNIAVRDGLMFLDNQTPPRPRSFSLTSMENIKGRKITSAGKGETVRIFYSPAPGTGSTVYKTSSHDLNWPVIKEESLPLWKKNLNIRITLTEDRLRASAETESISYSFSRGIVPEKSRSRNEFREILLPLFKASGEGWFGCGSMDFINKSSLEDDRIFIPPKILKAFRREFFDGINGLLEKGNNDNNIPKKTKKHTESRPGIPRTALVPKNLKPVPFALPGKLFDTESFCTLDGKTYIPLMPVLFNPKPYFDELNRLLDSGNGKNYVLGLNSITHLAWTDKLTERDNVSFFIDYGLYTANSRTLNYYRDRIPKLEFCYFWIEGSRDDYENLADSLKEGDPPLYFIEKDFKPHLFLSRACHTNNINGGNCPSACPKDFKYELRQKNRNFTVIVKDCMTWLFDAS